MKLQLQPEKTTNNLDISGDESDSSFLESENFIVPISKSDDEYPPMDYESHTTYSSDNNHYIEHDEYDTLQDHHTSTPGPSELTLQDHNMSFHQQQPKT